MSEPKAKPRAKQTAEEPIPAGVFSEWLEAFEASLLGDRENDVPCGDCIGCCNSSYFIHIKPTDVRALQAIPPDLRFSAPGMPEGHSLLGYDRKGACPMMKAGRCAIYASRPGTCKAYDCRVFAAAGIPAGGREKDGVNQRVKRWIFAHPTPHDRMLHDAVIEAARFISNRAEVFPGGRAPDNPSQIAILAVRSRSLFLEGADRATPEKEIARRIVEIDRDTP